MSFEQLLQILFGLAVYYFIFRRGRKRFQAMRREGAPERGRPEPLPAAPRGGTGDLFEELRELVEGKQPEATEEEKEPAIPATLPPEAGPIRERRLPLAPGVSARRSSPPRRSSLSRRLFSRRSLRESIVIAEILGPPLSMRRRSGIPGAVGSGPRR